MDMQRDTVRREWLRSAALVEPVTLTAPGSTGANGTVADRGVPVMRVLRCRSRRISQPRSRPASRAIRRNAASPMDWYTLGSRTFGSCSASMTSQPS